MVRMTSASSSSSVMRPPCSCRKASEQGVCDKAKARNSQICALSGPHSQNCEKGMLRVLRLGARKADPASIVRSKSVMSIVRNLESSDLDIIATFIHTAFSIYSMSGGGPGHRSDCQRSSTPPTMFNCQLAMMLRHVIMYPVADCPQVQHKCLSVRNWGFSFWSDCIQYSSHALLFFGIVPQLEGIHFDSDSGRARL